VSIIHVDMQINVHDIYVQGAHGVEENTLLWDTRRVPQN